MSGRNSSRKGSTAAPDATKEDAGASSSAAVVVPLADDRTPHKPSPSSSKAGGSNPTNNKKRKAPLQLVTPLRDDEDVEAQRGGAEEEEKKQEDWDAVTAKLNLGDADAQGENKGTEACAKVAPTKKEEEVHPAAKPAPAAKSSPAPPSDASGDAAEARPTKRRKVVLACAGAAIVAVAAAAGASHHQHHLRGGPSTTTARPGIVVPEPRTPRNPFAESILRIGSELLAAPLQSNKGKLGTAQPGAASSSSTAPRVPHKKDHKIANKKGAAESSFPGEAASSAATKKAMAVPAADAKTPAAEKAPRNPLSSHFLFAPFAAHRDAVTGASIGGAPPRPALPGGKAEERQRPWGWTHQLRRAVARAVDGAADVISGASAANLQLRG